MAKAEFARIGIISVLAWLLAMALGLGLGSVANADYELIYQLRLPRVLMASAVGMGLALAGVALQSLFANPLCEPYTLGISSGATLGAVIGVSLGVQASFSGVSLPAFAGALLFGLILQTLSFSRGVTNVSLLLAGVMLGFFGSSWVAVWMALTDANGIQAAMFWLLGDLSRARLNGALFSMLVVILMGGVLWRGWRNLDALLMGEEGALGLGVSVPRVRRLLILISSFLVGICVSGGGMIGFVGLVIPHFARSWVGSLHFRLVPIAAIWGATVLVLADTLARVMIRPYELPVGVVTALAGAPLFLWMMMSNRRRA